MLSVAVLFKLVSECETFKSSASCQRDQDYFTWIIHDQCMLQFNKSHVTAINVYMLRVDESELDIQSTIDSDINVHLLAYFALFH